MQSKLTLHSGTMHESSPILSSLVTWSANHHMQTGSACMKHRHRYSRLWVRNTTHVHLVRHNKHTHFSMTASREMPSKRPDCRMMSSSSRGSRPSLVLLSTNSARAHRIFFCSASKSCASATTNASHVGVAVHTGVCYTVPPTL